MKIEIWSDFVCPFCYIGKKRLEMALNKFEYKEKVEFQGHEASNFGNCSGGKCKI